MTITTHTVAELIAAALAETELAAEHAAKEYACAAATTEAEWDACIEAFGERTCGNFVADWEEDAAYHPHASEGVAMFSLADDKAVITQWFDDGRADTWTASLEDARQIVREYDDAHDAGDDAGDDADDDGEPEPDCSGVEGDVA